jgi:hypothetical protein
MQAVGAPLTLAAGSNGISSVKSAAFTPSALGTWCFSASYADPSHTYNNSSDNSIDGCFTVTVAPPPQAPVVTSPVQAGCYQTGNGGATCVSWPGAVTGTAADPGGPGIATVTVAVKDPLGNWAQCSNNGTCTWSSSPAANKASGTSPWTMNFKTNSFPNKDTGWYLVVVTATDTAGNTGPSTSVAFQWTG